MDVYIWSKNTKHMPLAEAVRDKKSTLGKMLIPI